jgi:hypothetical protein
MIGNIDGSIEENWINLVILTTLEYLLAKIADQFTNISSCTVSCKHLPKPLHTSSSSSFVFFFLTLGVSSTSSSS